MKEVYVYMYCYKEDYEDHSERILAVTSNKKIIDKIEKEILNSNYKETSDYNDRFCVNGWEKEVKHGIYWIEKKRVAIDDLMYSI